MTLVAGSVREALASATNALRAAGVESPRLDAEVLLAAASGRERAALVGDPRHDVTAAGGRLFGEMVRRRLRREPVAYIVGRKGFRHIELAVDRRALIPRPETELLVELALEVRPGRLLDVGTGSGAIALAVADELEGCEVTATDTSASALSLARANAERLGLSDRIRFLEGTIPDEGNAADVSGSAFDLILVNLPYVAEAEWPTLEPEVTNWEPREALLAGPDGLDAYRGFVPRLSRRTSSRHPATTAPSTEQGHVSVPTVGLEVGAGQAGAVEEMLREAGFAETETRRDLAGIERVVIGRR